MISWNVAGRVKALDAQAERVLALDADLVCLQETTRTTLPVWTELLERAGYRVHAGPDDAHTRARPLSVLSASRSAMRRVKVAHVPWPERVLATRDDATGIELVNVHSPISARPDQVKLRTHLAVYAHLASDRPGPRILCGDLNTPRRELPNGTVWTFARDRYGRLREDRGESWDLAEQALLRGLEPFGFLDAFRTLHGYAQPEISWGWPRWSGGYRLDHLLVRDVRVDACHYQHAWRIDGLSDHSPLVASLGLDAAKRTPRDTTRTPG